MRPSSVDLPLPDGPATATNWCARDLERHVGEDVDGPPTAHESQRQPAHADHRAILHRGPTRHGPRLRIAPRPPRYRGLVTAMPSAARSRSSRGPPRSARRARRPRRFRPRPRRRAALGVRPARHRRLRRQPHRRARGDAGRDVSRRARRAARAPRATRYRVVNAGVSGDTTAGGLRRVDWALRLKPDDRDRGARRQRRAPRPGARRRARQPRAASSSASRPAGARVLVAGHAAAAELRRSATPTSSSGSTRRWRRPQGAPSCRSSSTASAAIARLNQPDGIHPTAEGYRIIVDRLWPYLRPLLCEVGELRRLLRARPRPLP